MVAPHDTGDLVRSLVRVPGSGSDRTAGSECLDLARASSLAASVPVPQTLPPALASPKQQKVVNKKLGSQVGEAAGILGRTITVRVNDRKRQRPEESPADASVSSSNGAASSSSSSQPAKRARVVFMTPQEVMSQVNRVVPVSTSMGPVLFMQPQNSNGSPQVTLNDTTLAQLIQERNNLRQENQQLQQRLNLFQQLFRDKKRLGSVVKRLGVEVP